MIEKSAKTFRVSVDSAGNEANGGSLNPVISANGMYVSFQSYADNLVADLTSTYSGNEIFVHGPLPQVLELTIDIAPRRDPNRINPEHGQIEVAILGDESFDLTLIDPQSVRFGPAEAPSLRDRIVDINRDGAVDWVFSFKTEETGISCSDSEATLRGETYDETAFAGTDRIITLCCR